MGLIHGIGKVVVGVAFLLSFSIRWFYRKCNRELTHWNLPLLRGVPDFRSCEEFFLVLTAACLISFSSTHSLLLQESCSTKVIFCFSLAFVGKKRSFSESAQIWEFLQFYQHLSERGEMVTFNGNTLPYHPRGSFTPSFLHRGFLLIFGFPGQNPK
jgi:hypothetical protein